MQKLKNKFDISNIKKILIIQTAFLGDTVLTIPLFNNLRQLFPDKKIYVLTTPVGKTILEEQKSIDEIIVYDKKGADKGLVNFFRLIDNLKLLSIDWAIIPHRSFRSAFSAYFAKIPHRWGFTRSSARMFYTKIIKYQRNLHDLERNLCFLEEFSNSKFDKSIYFPYNNVYEKKINDLLNEKDFVGHKIIGIHSGSKWPTKKWPISRFVELINELDKKNYKIIVFGNKEDFLLDNYLNFKQNSKNIINLIGKTNIKELVTIIRHLFVYVTNDSGPMHIASAMERNVIAIFGPTTKGLGFYPYNENAKIIEVNLKCRPCGMHGGYSCPRRHFKCMNDITVSAVVREIENLFQK